MEYIKLTDGLCAMYRESVIPRDAPVVFLAFAECDRDRAVSSVGRDLVEKEFSCVVFSSSSNISVFLSSNKVQSATDTTLPTKSREITSQLNSSADGNSVNTVDIKEDNISFAKLDTDTLVSRTTVIAFAVTEKLLQTSEYCSWLLSEAQNKKITVLPILIEEVDLVAYSRLFGSVQYLNRVCESEHGVSYEEKLSNFFHSAVLSSKIRENIRNSFRGVVFLSYRKADRAAAIALMKRIHSLEGYCDLAIWYDEYITAGNSFDALLENEIKSADGFIMAMTPRMLEVENYVSRVEYPLARSLGKPIIPIGALPCLVDTVGEIYPSCPHVITEDSDILAALDGIFGERELDIDSERKYHLGLAYLYGVDVELDSKRGFELISAAAEEGYADAILKLSALYEFGLATESNIDRAADVLIVGYNQLLDEAEEDDSVFAANYLSAYNILVELVELDMRRDRLEELDNTTDSLVNLALAFFKDDFLTDSPLAFIDALRKRLSALEQIGDPVLLIKEAAKYLSCLEGISLEGLSLDAVAAYIELLGIISYAEFLVGETDRSRKLMREAISCAKDVWTRRKSYDTALALSVVLYKVIDNARADEESEIGQMLLNYALYCYDEKRSAVTRDKLIRAHLRFAYALFPDEKEEMLENMEDAKALIEELDPADRERYRTTLAYLEAEYLLALGKATEAFVIFEEQLSEMRKGADKYRTYPCYRQVALDAHRLAKWLRYEEGREEDSYVYLAIALDYATRAVELNTSPEGYRTLSSIYDTISKAPFVKGDSWKGARRNNAKEHTKYTVDEQKTKEEDKKIIKPKVLLCIFLSVLFALSLTAVILLRERDISELFLILLLVVCAYSAIYLIKNIYVVIKLRRVLSGVKTEIKKDRENFDYERRVRQDWRFYKLSERFLLVSAVTLTVSIALLLVNGFGILKLPTPIVVFGWILLALSFCTVSLLHSAEDSLDRLYQYIAGVNFGRRF